MNSISKVGVTIQDEPSSSALPIATFGGAKVEWDGTQWYAGGAGMVVTSVPTASYVTNPGSLSEVIVSASIPLNINYKTVIKVTGQLVSGTVEPAILKIQSSAVTEEFKVEFSGTIPRTYQFERFGNMGAATSASLGFSCPSAVSIDSANTYIKIMKL